MGVHVDEKFGVAILKPPERILAADVKALLEEMLAHPAFRPGTPSVWDLSGVDVSRLDPRSMTGVTQFLLDSSGERGQARVAFVAPEDVAFGIARMFEVLSSVPHLDTGVFRELDEALSWASQGRPEQPGGEA